MDAGYKTGKEIVGFQMQKCEDGTPNRQRARTTTENDRGGKVDIKVCVSLSSLATAYFSLSIQNRELSSYSVFSIFSDCE